MDSPSALLRSVRRWRQALPGERGPPVASHRDHPCQRLYPRLGVLDGEVGRSIGHPDARELPGRDLQRLVPGEFRLKWTYDLPLDPVTPLINNMFISALGGTAQIELTPSILREEIIDCWHISF